MNEPVTPDERLVETLREIFRRIPEIIDNYPEILGIIQVVIEKNRANPRFNSISREKAMRIGLVLVVLMANPKGCQPCILEYELEKFETWRKFVKSKADPSKELQRELKLVMATGVVERVKIEDLWDGEEKNHYRIPPSLIPTRSRDVSLLDSGYRLEKDVHSKITEIQGMLNDLQVTVARIDFRNAKYKQFSKVQMNTEEHARL